MASYSYMHVDALICASITMYIQLFDEGNTDELALRKIDG